MRKSEKIGFALAVLSVMLLPVVAAYTFTIDNVVELSGTTFDIDDETFKYEGGEHFVYLENEWWELEDETYTYDATTITMLDDVTCEYVPSGPFPGSGIDPKCCNGGGCGS